MVSQKAGDVREALDMFLIRVMSGNAKAPEEIAILPQMVEKYFAYAPAAALESVAASGEQAPPPFPTDGYVSIKQIAAFLDISEDTVRRRQKDGNLPGPVRRGHKDVKYSAVEYRVAATRMEAKRKGGGDVGVGDHGRGSVGTAGCRREGEK